jgi:hypothetical protein
MGRTLFVSISIRRMRRRGHEASKPPPYGKKFCKHVIAFAKHVKDLTSPFHILKRTNNAALSWKFAL